MKKAFLFLSVLAMLLCACAGQPSETTAPTESVPDTVEVTFQPNNGDALTVFSVKKGTTAPEAPVPEKRACVFSGWYMGETKWDPSAPVEADVTVTALDENDQELQTRTFADVPLRNGYKTNYRGTFFIDSSFTSSSGEI